MRRATGVPSKRRQPTQQEKELKKRKNELRNAIFDNINDSLSDKGFYKIEKLEIEIRESWVSFPLKSVECDPTTGAPISIGRASWNAGVLAHGSWLRHDYFGMTIDENETSGPRTVIGYEPKNGKVVFKRVGGKRRTKIPVFEAGKKLASQMQFDNCIKKKLLLAARFKNPNSFLAGIAMDIFKAIFMMAFPTIIRIIPQLPEVSSTERIW